MGGEEIEVVVGVIGGCNGVVATLANANICDLSADIIVGI